MNLLRAISRHRIILDSPRFSAFASLVQLILFSTSQPWAVWLKDRGVTSSSSSIGLHCSPRVSSGARIFPSLYNFPNPTQSSWSYLLPTRCAWTHLLSCMPQTQLTRHFRCGRNVLFTLGSRCTSCYAVCQRDLSGQYSTLFGLPYDAQPYISTKKLMCRRYLVFTTP